MPAVGTTRKTGRKVTIIKDRDRTREMNLRSRGAGGSTQDGAPTNKTNQVRTAIGNNPEVGPAEIRRILQRKGIEVSPSLVGYVHRQMRGGKEATRKQGGGTPAGARRKR